MTLMLKRLPLLIGLLAFASGCSQRLVDYTMISTKNIDLSRASSFTRAKQRVEGKDTIHIIIFIPTGVPNMKEAIDRAIESVPGAIALVDGVLYHKGFWLLYGQSWYVIEGTPLIDPALVKAPTNPDTGYIVARCDRLGKVERVSHVTQPQYAAIVEKAIPGRLREQAPSEPTGSGIQPEARSSP